MLPISRFLALTMAAALPLQVAKGEPLAVDENLFLQQPVDFTPATEKELDEKLLAPPEKPYPFPTARIVRERGAVGLEIGGERLPGWSRVTGVMYTPGSPVERQLREAGVKLYMIDVGLTADTAEKRPLATAPDAAFAQFSRSADNLLAAVPDAWIMIRFWMLNVDRDFAEAYPKSLLMGPNGETDWGYSMPGHTGHTTRPNMLNDWRRYSGEHLHRFIHRLGQSKYAPKVGGFYLAAMNSGEWWYYKGKGDPGWDYSETRQAAFEHFVKAKYGDDLNAIAKAWGVPVNDDLLKLPTLKERAHLTVMPNSKVSDYLQVMNQPVTNAARYFARIIKAATHGRALAGLEVHVAGITYPINGTVFMNHLLDAPEIDIFGGPPQYGGRGSGSSSLYRMASQSLAAHNKIWWNEGDYRTPIAHDTPSGAAGEPPMDTEGMKGVLRREFARGAVFNYPTYLMDFGWRWFLYPSFMESMKEVVKADAAVQAIGLERKAEIAIVTDQESQLYGNYYANPTQRMLGHAMDRLGAAWDFYELRDFLAAERYRQYKLVIFLNICALSDDERARLEPVKSDGRHVLWMHNPGAISLSSRGTRQPDLISSLIGMEVKVKPVQGKVSLVKGDLAQELPNGKSLGEKGEIPRTVLNVDVSISDGGVGLAMGNAPSQFYVADGNAEVLAQDESGKAYFARQKNAAWTSIYTAFCDLPPPVLRALIRDAGCHLWVTSNDVSFVAGNLVAIHASSDGEKEIALPAGFDGIALDLFEGAIVTPMEGRLTFPMLRGQTRMFALGDASLQAKWKEAARGVDEETARFIVRNPPNLMPSDFMSRYTPKAPKETGATALMHGVHTSRAPVYLVAGPFPSDAESVAALDGKLASLTSVAQWEEANLTGKMGRHSSDFLSLAEPLQPQQPKEGLGPWKAWEARWPWITSDDLGVAQGQTFAVALWLEAPEKTGAELILHPRGETRLWVNGKEVMAGKDGRFQHPLVIGKERCQIVFRVRGDDKPVGLALKLVNEKRGRGLINVSDMPLRADKNATHPVPETVVQWVPPKASAKAPSELAESSTD